MSRIGKIPVPLPKTVKFAVDNGAVRLEGPKGKLAFDLPQGVTVAQKEAALEVSRSGNSKQARSNHGTARAILQHMVEGVTEGHQKDLEIVGVGFRASMKGSQLVINLGFSHPVEFDVPKDVKVAVASQTSISVTGCDKAMVGLVAAKIRDLKRPEPYKGKGIRYAGEQVRRKQGKSVSK